MLAGLLPSLTAAGALLFSLTCWSAPLDPLVREGQLWSALPADLVERHRDAGFHWLSNAQDAAETTEPGTTLFGLPVYQAVARFEGDRLREFAVLFYAAVTLAD